MFSKQEKQEHLQQIISSSIQAVDSYAAVKQTVKLKRNVLHVKQGGNDLAYDIEGYKNIYIVSFGKAAWSMAKAAAEVLEGKYEKGILITKYGHISGDVPSGFKAFEASHPVPDENGLKACREMVELLSEAGEGDLVIALVSGGGSALCPLPVDGVSLGDKLNVTQALLKSGADIHEVNTIRKKLSAFKGGGAALAAQPATVLALVISDVIGDDLDTISSGPFFPCMDGPDKIKEILEKYNLNSLLENRIVDKLLEPQSSTPVKPDTIQHVICASNGIAVNKAGEIAQSLGYSVYYYPGFLEGNVIEASHMFSGFVKENRNDAPCCYIAGGETTVQLPENHGKGGRNQHFALQMLQEGLPGEYVFASIGTDGTDGPTDAAGALVDNSTKLIIEQKGFDYDTILQRCDAYTLFKQTGNLYVTGPTNTNVMDLQIALI